MITMNTESIVSNVCICGLHESIVASGYPMLTNPPDESSFVEMCKDFVLENINSRHYKRAMALSNTTVGEGHDNFLNGIVVQFDLNFSVKAWVEAERYHFFDFVSSMSSMHRLTKMNFDNVFNKNVSKTIVEEMKTLQEEYNENPTIENKLALLYSCPMGLQLTARMTTNYRQLKTIYKQRKNHQLPEWRQFCDWIEQLPYSEFIVGHKQKQ